jgi:cupin fold WbuC family metalloprotein
MNGALPGFRLIDAVAVEALLSRSRSEARKRAHLLLHAGHDDPVQRLLIAAQPGTYVRPHSHSQQWEMLVLQRGALDILFFDSQGLFERRARLEPSSPVIHIPMGRLHGCVVHTPDTIVVEIKPGPYRPNEFADWSPEEGHVQANEFMRWASSVTGGQKWSSGQAKRPAS